MIDYLSAYGHSQEVSAVRTFQAGGPAPAPVPGPEGAPVGGPPPPGAGGGGDLQAELMQIVETQDPQMALAFCNKLAEQLAGAQGAPPAAGGPGGPPPPGAVPPPGAMASGGRMYQTGGKAVFSKAGGSLSFARK